MSTNQEINEEAFHIQSLLKNDYIIYLSIKSEALLIKGCTIDQIPILKYQTSYTFEDIKKINKYFRICDSINEIFMELKNIIKKNLTKMKIFENSNGNLILTFPLSSSLVEEINFNLEKCIIDEKQEITDLYKLIHILSKNIKSMEEKYNNNKAITLNLESKIIELEKENKSLKENIKK